MFALRVKNGDLLAYISVFFAVFSWALNWIVGRAMKDDIGPVAMGFWRWFIAFLLILPFCWREMQSKWSFIWTQRYQLCLLGLLGAVAFNTFLYVGLQYTKPSNASLINTAVPTFIFLLSYLVNKEPIRKLQILGLLLSTIGVGVVVFRGDLSLFRSLTFNAGDLWILLAMSFWATYTVLLKSRSVGVSPLLFLTATLMFSLPFVLPFYFWEYSVRGGFAVNLQTIATLIFYGTVPSILAYMLWNHGVRTIGANRTGIFVYLMPLLTISLAVIFLGESVFGYHAVGAGAIFFGIWLTSR